jgi:hypothetical protein
VSNLAHVITYHIVSLLLHEIGKFGVSKQANPSNNLLLVLYESPDQTWDLKLLHPYLMLTLLLQHYKIEKKNTDRNLYITPVHLLSLLLDISL